ncbi:MAG: hypothetical protein H2069_01945 [Legionella sp.]|nr:hypothetical protein [Legionella sp.]
MKTSTNNVITFVNKEYDRRREIFLLEEAYDLLKEEVFPKKLVVDLEKFGRFNISDPFDIKTVSDNYTCSFERSTENVAVITAILASGKCQENTEIYFPRANAASAEVAELCQMLDQKKFSERITLYVPLELLFEHIHSFAKILNSDVEPKNLTLNFGVNAFCLDELLDSITKPLPDGCVLALDATVGSSDGFGMQWIADAFQAKKFRAHISLNLSGNDYHEERDWLPLIQNINHEKCPNHFSLDLSDCALYCFPKTLDKIVQNFSNRNYPRFFDLNLGGAVEENTVIALFEAIGEGKALEGLSLGLRSNNIGDQGILTLSKALQTGSCPKNMKIDLGNNCFTQLGFLSLLEGISHPNAPDGLTLDLNDNYLDEKSVLALVSALKKGVPLGLKITMKSKNYLKKTHNKVQYLLCSALAYMPPRKFELELY